MVLLLCGSKKNHETVAKWKKVAFRSSTALWSAPVRSVGVWNRRSVDPFERVCYVVACDFKELGLMIQEIFSSFPILKMTLCMLEVSVIGTAFNSYWWEANSDQQSGDSGTCHRMTGL